MLKLVCLFLSIAISITANADQCSESSCVLSADAPVVDVANANQPKEVIVHKIKKDIYPLPTCNDEALIKAIRNYVDESLEKAMIFLHKSTFGVQLKSGKILALTPDGKYIQVGSFANNDKLVIEVKLQAVKTRKVRVELTDFSTRDRMLEEIEIYGK